MVTVTQSTESFDYLTSTGTFTTTAVDEIYTTVYLTSTGQFLDGEIVFGRSRTDVLPATVTSISILSTVPIEQLTATETSDIYNTVYVTSVQPASTLTTTGDPLASAVTATSTPPPLTITTTSIPPVSTLVVTQTTILPASTITAATVLPASTLTTTTFLPASTGTATATETDDYYYTSYNTGTGQPLPAHLTVVRMNDQLIPCSDRHFGAEYGIYITTNGHRHSYVSTASTELHNDVSPDQHSNTKCDDVSALHSWIVRHQIPQCQRCGLLQLFHELHCAYNDCLRNSYAQSNH